jgi:hypothetical protein
MTHFGKGHGALGLLTAGFEAQGQLQLLPWGQDQELPEDQDLGDHDPGPVDQDEGP